MRIPRKALLVLAIGLITLTILVAFLYTSPLLIITERLRVDEFEKQGTDVYITEVWDSDGNELVHPYFLIPSEVSTTPFGLRFRIWHAEGTKLDSLTLAFSCNSTFELAWLAPRGSLWPRTDFHWTEDGEPVILDIPDLEFQGTGTVTLEFYLESFQYHHLELNINLSFSLHKDPPFSFTRYTACASLQAAVEILK